MAAKKRKPNRPPRYSERIAEAEAQAIASITARIANPPKLTRPRTRPDDGAYRHRVLEGGKEQRVRNWEEEGI